MPLISITCSCGKTLKVGAQYLGKKAKCPECGSLVLVEEAETGVQESKPMSRAAAADADDEPETRKPVRRPVAQRSMMPMLLGGGCAVIALLACVISAGVGGWWYYSKGKAEQGKVEADKVQAAEAEKARTDLTFVHDGVVGFVSVRIADGWTSPTVKDQLRLMPMDMKIDMDKNVGDYEAKFGLKVADLERATTIIRSAEFGPNDQDIAFVLRTTKAMDRKRIVDVLVKENDARQRELKHDGATYYVLERDVGKVVNKPIVVHFASDFILVASPSEATLKDILTRSKNPAKNAALVRGIEMAAAGKHQIVAACQVNHLLMGKMPPQLLLQMDAQTPGLRDTTGVILAGKLGAVDAEIEAIFTYADNGAATRAKKDVDMVKALAQIAFNGKGVAPPSVAKFANSITVDQRGNEVIAHGRIDADLKDFGPGIFGVARVRAAAGRTQSMNNLKQIGLALHSFHAMHKALPNHAIRHPQTGQPLHSWRVALLPHLGEQALFNQIRLTEPWTSDHNRQLWHRMPKVYQLDQKAGLDHETYYQAFQGEGSAFPRTKKAPQVSNLVGDVRLTQILDGTSNTIFVIEAGNPVNWMSPEDLPFTMNDATITIRAGNHWGTDTFQALFGDGTVRNLRRTLPWQTLQGLVTINGNEVINPADLAP